MVILPVRGGERSGHWKTYLLWRNGVPFNKRTCTSTRTSASTSSTIPWYRYLLSFGFTVLVLSILAAGATHYLYGAIRLPAKHDRMTRSAQMHLSVLLGLFVSLKAVAYWLDRYGLAIHQGSLITGITYTDAHAVLPSKNVLMIISIICALLFFGNVVRPGLAAAAAGLRDAGAVRDPDRRHLAAHRATVPGQALRAEQGGAVHPEEHHRHAGRLRPERRADQAVPRRDEH